MLCRKFHPPETIVDKQQLYSYPRVGVAVIVTHQQTVLFGKRVVTSGKFAWQLPGGWIGLGESPEQTASREPARCEQWIWMQWQELQNNLYLPLQLLKDTDYQPFLGDQCGVHVSF